MKAFRFLSIVLAAGILASCAPAGPAPTPAVEVSGISLSETDITIVLEEEKTLTATVTPSNATDKTVTWSSSDAKVASVDNGKIKGLAAGTATITAKAGEKTATCKVTVNKPDLVMTGDVVGISFNSASVTLKVFFQYADAGAKFEDAGVVYGKTQTLDVKKDSYVTVVKDKDGNIEKAESYTVQPFGLDEGTTYYYQAYAIFDGKYHMGQVKSFKTTTMNISTAQSVDLGLPSGLKWAGWNVGATKPEEFGNYYVWGCADPTTKYVSKWLKNKEKATKYGAIDGKNVLDLEDDAAAVNWGDKWRMPTEKEKMELLANTTHEKIEYKGVKGWIFTSKINGASIFIPAAGFNVYGSPMEVGTFTAFWASTLCPSDERGASFACDHVANGGKFEKGSMIYELGFYWECATSQRQYMYRWYGMPIRAVWDKDCPEVQFNPTLELEYPSGETASSAKLEARIRNFFRNGRTAADLPEFGFCIKKGLGTSPTISDTKVTCAVSDGKQDGFDFVYTKVVTGLDPDSDYALSAYAMLTGSTATYAVGYKFRTLPDYSSMGLDPTLKAVDLGLPSGIKWAGWNVGATRLDELGSYFMWGDPRPYTNDNPIEYKWFDNTTSMYTKYVMPGEEKYGTVDNLTVLEPSDDPATVNFGPDFRSPTVAEWKELFANTTQRQIQYKDKYDRNVNCILVTGPNGKSILFPERGTGSIRGVYWTRERLYDPNNVTSWMVQYPPMVNIWTLYDSATSTRKYWIEIPEREAFRSTPNYVRPVQTK